MPYNEPKDQMSFIESVATLFVVILFTAAMWKIIDGILP